MFCVTRGVLTTGILPQLFVKRVQDDRGFDPIVQEQGVRRDHEAVHCADVPVNAAQQGTRVVDFRDARGVLPVGQPDLVQVQVRDVRIEAGDVDAHG